LPSASVAAWILVLKPPREWPRPWACAPFGQACPGCVLAGVHNGAVEEKPFQVGLAGQGGQDAIQRPAFDPAVVAPLDCLMIAKTLRQVAPAPARTAHPQQRVHETSVVTPRPALPSAATGYQVPQPLPWIVAQSVRVAAHLGRSPKPALNTSRSAQESLNPGDRHHRLVAICTF
jgi:hypothetical protein